MTVPGRVPRLPPPAHQASSLESVRVREFVAESTGTTHQFITAAGRLVHVDRHGQLTDPGQWDVHVAESLSDVVGVTMTASHRNVIAAVRLDFNETGAAPTLIRTSRLTGLDVGRLVHLFPGTPARTMAYIAGLGPLPPKLV